MSQNSIIGLRKIFIIEDNPADVELLKFGLHHCRIKADLFIFDRGEKAINHLKELSVQDDRDRKKLPELMFLDLHLEGAHGLDTLKEIKAHSVWKSIPVIVVTSSEDSIDVIQTYRLGGIYFMKKPWTKEVLKEVLDQMTITGVLKNKFMSS